MLRKFRVIVYLFFVSLSSPVFGSSLTVDSDQLQSFVDECSDYNKDIGTDSIYFSKIDSLKVLIDAYSINYKADEVYLKAFAFYAKSTSEFNPIKSLEIYFKLIQISHDNGFKTSESISIHELGKLYQQNGLENEALGLYIKSSALFEELEDWGAYAYSLVDIGNIFFIRNDSETARIYYQQAKDVFIKYKSEEKSAYDLAVCESNFGEVESDLGNHEKAIEYYKKGLYYRKLDKLEAYYSYSYYYIGNAYAEMNEIDSALFYISKAMDNNLKLNLMNEYAFSVFFYGSIVIKKDSQLALEYFHKSLALSKVQNNINLINRCNSNIATYYLNSNEDSAIYYFTKVYNTSVLNISNQYKIRSAKELIELYQKKNDLVNQLKYLKVYNELILNKNKDVIAKTEFQVKEYQWQKELASVKLDAQRKKIYSIFGVIIIVILLIFVLIILINQRKIKRFSNQLSRLNKEQQELIKRRDVVYAIIAHDLRGPLGSSKSLLELMVEEDLTKDECKPLVSKVRDSVSATFNLLENLLSWANTNIGNVNYSPDFYDLYEIVKEQELIFSEQIIKKNVQIINDISKLTMAYIDYNSISTVVRNLISNAIKYSKPKGKISISSQLKENLLVISVKDEGIGMEQELVETILVNEVKTSIKGTLDESGTGLGLKLCTEFVQTNKGDIWIESKVNEGSVFSFSIPIQK